MKQTVRICKETKDTLTGGNSNVTVTNISITAEVRVQHMKQLIVHKTQLSQ